MFVRKSDVVKASVFKIVCFAVSFCIFSFCISNFLFSKQNLTVSANSSNKLVIIDAGHGGEDCGAIGIFGVYEKDLNLQIALILGKYLKNAGYTVVFTRTEDKLLYTEEQNIKGFRKIYDLKNRLAFADLYPDAYFISIHMNSFSESKYSGFQTYYGTKNQESAKLAEAIQNEVINRTQKSNQRKIKRGEGLYLMENAQNTSVLLECGFLTNEEESAKLCEKEYQKELCFAIVCGIIYYDTKVVL